MNSFKTGKIKKKDNTVTLCFEKVRNGGSGVEREKERDRDRER